MTPGQNQMHQQHPPLHEPVPAPTTPLQYFAHCVVVVHDPFANGSLHAAAGRTSARSDAAPNTSAAPTAALNSVARIVLSVFGIQISRFEDGAYDGMPARPDRQCTIRTFSAANSEPVGRAFPDRSES